MAELKSAAQPSAAARAQTEVSAEDLTAQIAALRADLAKLSETVVAVGQGAKSVVSEEASAMTERVRDKVRDEPLFALAVTAGIAYMIGLLSRR
jgi:ElaB/YqjD/DUF883 family membrane-anchored ribosome-binding protein